MVIALCNVVGSTIAREAGEENTLYTYAGPEIAVASTKAYTTQAELLFLLGMALGKMRGHLTAEQAEALAAEVRALPEKMETALKTEPQLQRIASTASQKKHVFFVGRGHGLCAFDGGGAEAEGGQLHFQARPTPPGELKHGPIALLQGGPAGGGDASPSPPLLDKAMSNLRRRSSRARRTGSWPFAGESLAGQGGAGRWTR